jgi:hypothetical protein
MLTYTKGSYSEQNVVCGNWDNSLYPRIFYLYNYENKSFVPGSDNNLCYANLIYRTKDYFNTEEAIIVIKIFISGLLK